MALASTHCVSSFMEEKTFVKNKFLKAWKLTLADIRREYASRAGNSTPWEAYILSQAAQSFHRNYSKLVFVVESN